MSKITTNETSVLDFSTGNPYDFFMRPAAPQSLTYTALVDGLLYTDAASNVYTIDELEAR